MYKRTKKYFMILYVLLLKTIVTTKTVEKSFRTAECFQSFQNQFLHELN